MISSHHFNSWFECGEKCLDNEDCVSFSHRTTSSDDINCIIASESDEIVIKNPHEVDTWTTYELRESISVSTCTAVFNLKINPTDWVHMHPRSRPKNRRSYTNPVQTYKGLFTRYDWSHAILILAYENYCTNPLQFV